MPAPVIAVEHLYKVFGRNPREAVARLERGEPRAALQPAATAAVIDASFEVQEGEIFVVMGLSGSGKSTLLRAVNGLNKVTRGEVIVHDGDWAADFTGAVPSAGNRPVSAWAVDSAGNVGATATRDVVVTNAIFGSAPEEATLTSSDLFVGDDLVTGIAAADGPSASAVPSSNHPLAYEPGGGAFVAGAWLPEVPGAYGA